MLRYQGKATYTGTLELYRGRLFRPGKQYDIKVIDDPSERTVDVIVRGLLSDIIIPYNRNMIGKIWRCDDGR